MLETHLLFLPYWQILDLFIAGIWTRPPQNGQNQGPVRDQNQQLAD